MDEWILIGCPVLAREWILPDWFQAIERQDWPLEKLGFVFDTAPDDKETLSCLTDFSARHPELRRFDILTNTHENHEPHPDLGRSWNHEKYKKMVRMRNRLLARAVCYEPSRYFSLDTDILLENPTTISQLFKLTSTLDAVAPLCFMTPADRDYPNVMTWIPETPRAMRRNDYPLGSLFQADIIMAAVMMSEPVYHKTLYQWHSQGEDLGWSRYCAEVGFKLYSASYLYAPHLMFPPMLEAYKQTGDPRSIVSVPSLSPLTSES